MAEDVRVGVMLIRVLRNNSPRRDLSYLDLHDALHSFLNGGE